MKDKRRIALLVIIMTVVSAIVGGISMTMLYNAAFKEEEARLTDIVENQARLIEAVARFDTIHSPGYPGGAGEATLSQIIDAHAHYIPSVPTQEIVIGRRDGDTMLFLVRTNPEHDSGPERLPFDSELAVPMHRALSGLSGTMIGLDYHGDTVLAAYRPLTALGLGIVAKVDLAQVRAPFVRAGATAGLLALLLVVAGAIVFLRVSAPVIRHIEESEERYRDILENITDIIYIFDDRGNVKFVNDAAARKLGYSSDELRKLNTRTLLTPDSYQSVARIYMSQIQGEDVGPFEIDLYDKEGRIHTIESKERLLWDGDRIIEVHGIGRDVTEKKKAEAAFQASELKYRSMILNLSEGFYSATLDGILIDHNIEFNRILGFDPEASLVDMRLPDFWENPEDRSQYLKRLKRDGIIRSYLIAAKKQNGEKIFVEASARIIEDDQGKPAHIEGSFIEATDRVRAQDALAKSLTFLDSIIDQSPVAMWISDENGTLVRLNRACCDLLNITPEEVIGKYNVLNDNIVKEQGHLPEVKGVFERGETARFEVTYDTTRVEGLALKGAASVYLDVTIFPVRDNAGKITNAVIQHKDITERKRAEEALRTNEAFTKAVLDNLPVGVAVNSVDPTVAFEYMNDNFVKFYRTSRKKLAEPDGFWAAIYEDPEFRERIRKRVLDDCASGDPARMFWQDIPIARKGKETHFITARNIPVPDKPLMISTVWDITDRRRAEEALRESEVKYRTVADYNYDWEYWVGPSGRLIYVSPACERVTGYHPEEFMNNPNLLKSIIHPDDRESHARHESERDSRQIGQIDFRIITKSGQERWVAHACLDVFGDDGSPLGRRASNRDITERKEAEAEIKKLNEDLEQRVLDRTAQLEAANKELESFSYSVSHDLRAPLRAMDGFTRVLMEDYEKVFDDEGRRLTRIIRDNTQRMGKLIDDLLAFSRVGRSELQIVQVKMELLAQSVLFELTTEADRERIDFSVGSLPHADGDTTMLRQVWTNLVSNAVKFSSKKERAVIEITGQEHNAEIIYSIRDNGAGFDMKYSSKLFGVFQRLHGEREFPGTGVGLAIVQRVIARHGGRVWAEGEVDGGAVFYFSLPKHRGES